MVNYKNLMYLFGAAFLIVLLMLIFKGKETVYVCYDGTEQASALKCPAVPPLTISQKQADEAVTTYANAFAKSRTGVMASVINVYRLNSSWQSDVTFSNQKAGTFDTVTFRIDGKTATVSCLQGCAYLQGNTTS